MKNPRHAAVYVMLAMAGVVLAAVTIGPVLDVTASNFPKRFLAADLPVCDDSPSRDGRLYALLDPVDEGDCSVGGGTDPPHPCICNGATATYIAFPGPPVPFPATRINRDAPQTIADATPTFIIWDLESFDDDGWTDPGGANPTRMTFDFNGRALCAVSVVAINQPATENELCTEAFVNGLNASPNPGCFSISSSEGNAATFTDLLPFSSSDFLEIRLTQDTGGDLDIEATLSCQRTL